MKKWKLFFLPLLIIGTVTSCDFNKPIEINPTSFEISESSITLIKNTTEQLKCLVTPTESSVEKLDLTWKSTVPSVASVDENGVITAIKKGKATISATSEFLGTKKTCSVQVIDEAIYPSSIVLSSSNVYLAKGGSEKNSVTYLPSDCNFGKELTWSSSNKNVATVDSNGLITVSSNATIGSKTTITASLVHDSSIKDSCVVTILEHVSHPTTFSLNQTETTIAINHTYQLTAIFNPEDCLESDKEIEWTSAKNTVATVDENGLIKGVGIGTATIYAKSTYLGTRKQCSVKVTEEPVYPTGVSLNTDSAAIKAGGSTQLEVSYTPSNCNTGKGVTWSSSNTNVATVSTNGLVNVLNSASPNQTAIITATSTYNTSFKASCTITVKESIKDEWTVLMYVCGADLESDGGLATGDITEILSVAGQPDDINIVLETGGARKWNRTYGISPNYLGRYHVRNKNLVLDENISKACMGYSSTLQSFIEWGMSEYPAEKTALILWNHGGGMAGVCYDENYSNNSLTHDEVYTALKNAYKTLGLSSATNKLEFIGYDACLMAVQDVNEYVSEFAKFTIASEESESGYGWDYDTWVDDLYSNKTTTDILKAIVDGFIKDNGGTSSYKNDQTLSILDNSKFEAYKDAFESFTTALRSKLKANDVSTSTFKSFVKNNVKHYAGNDYDYFATFDVKDFINAINNSTYNPGISYITDLNDAFENLVYYESHGKKAGNSNGLCMFYPWSSGSISYNQTNFTNWKSFSQCTSY